MIELTSGNQRRDFIRIADVIDALRFIVESIRNNREDWLSFLGFVCSWAQGKLEREEAFAILEEILKTY